MAKSKKSRKKAVAHRLRRRYLTKADMERIAKDRVLLAELDEAIEKARTLTSEDLDRVVGAAQPVA